MHNISSRTFFIIMPYLSIHLHQIIQPLEINELIDKRPEALEIRHLEVEKRHWLSLLLN